MKDFAASQPLYIADIHTVDAELFERNDGCSCLPPPPVKGMSGKYRRTVILDGELHEGVTGAVLALYRGEA